MTLPKPLIHFDTLVKNELPFLKGALGLSPAQQERIVMDPTGESCGLAGFAQSYSTTYSMLRLSLMYRLNQEQVVVVGPKMQAAFAHTSLENVPIEMVKLPHPCFYVATPESEGLELWGGDRTQWHKVAGCYVAMDPSSDSNAIMILAWGAANEKSLDPLDDATFWFRLDMDRWAERLTNLEAEFSRSHSDLNIRETIKNIESESHMLQAADELIKEGKIKYPDAATALARTAAHRSVDLDKALTSLLEDHGKEASDHGAGYLSRGQTEEHVRRVRGTAQKLMRIVVNAILYMNSSNSDVSEPVTLDNDRAKLHSELKRLKKNPKKERIIKRRIDALSRSRVVWVGPTIEQSKDLETDFTEASGRRVSAHIRRGHWHTFLSGPRKVDGALVPKEQRTSTLKWMPPLWIGSAARQGPPGRTYGIKETELP